MLLNSYQMISALQSGTPQVPASQVKYCKEGQDIKWDYTNNDTILAQLKSFAEDLGGKSRKRPLPFHGTSHTWPYIISIRSMF